MDWNVITLATGALTGFLAFLVSMLRPLVSKPPPEPDRRPVVTEHDLVKEQIANIRNEVDSLKRNIQISDEKTMRTLDRFENRIEKLTDIIIEHIIE